ncbi:MAG: glycosyltransferase family 39 protein [Bryobacteraceae bacterium]
MSAPRFSWKGLATWLAGGLVAVCVWLTAANFRDGRLLAQLIWGDEGLPRLAAFTGVYLAAALPLLTFLPGAFPAALLLAVLVLTALSVGPLSVLGAAFFLFSACCLGWLLLGRSPRETVSAHICATLLGMGVYILVMYLVARAPVNYPAVWAVLLAFPAALDRRGAWRRLAKWGAALRAVKLRSKATRIALALLVFVLGMHWYAVLAPENSDDALAMHLAIPANIALHHALTFEPSRFIWAVTPMGADFTYSIAYVLGGEAAARLVNFALFLAISALLYRACRRWLGPAVSLLLVTAFVSTPLAQLVTGSLFVENLQAALIFGCLACLWHFGETGERRFFLASAALAGTALSVKFGSVAYAAAAAPVAIWEARRRWKSLDPKPLVTLVLAGALCLGAAAPPYLIAWVQTGNPLFPFLNERFPSPLLPPHASLMETRYTQPLGWRTLPELTFHTNSYYEGQDGSFGFQYLAVVPLALAALAGFRNRPAGGGAAVVALAGGVIVMAAEPNARYIYPALPLATAAFGSALGWIGQQNRWVFRSMVAYVCACIALNIWFLPASSWYHKDFGMPHPFSAKARERYMEIAAPIRTASQYMNRVHPGAAVLLTGDSSIADLQGEVYENTWRQFNTFDRIQKARDVDDLLRLLAAWKVRYFIAHAPDSGSPAEPETLAQLLATCTEPERRWNSIYVARLQQDCLDRAAVAPPVPRTEVPPPGLRDDAGPGVTYRGRWMHDHTGAERAYSHTLSYSLIAGDEASLSFDGSSVTYVYTRAFNRGIGEALIDGVSQGEIDLYSPKIEWRSQTKYAGLAPGRHTIAIRVTGKKNPASQGLFVDLDAFIVE